MIYSEERIKNLAFKIHHKLYMDELVDYPDEAKTLSRLKEIMIEFFDFDDQISKIVCKKLSTLKKGIVRGSAEWDILYQKYFEEEMRKHKM